MTSKYFTDILELYVADLADLQEDSQGNDVFLGRLQKEKIELFSDLIAFSDDNPELAIAAFYDRLSFSEAAVLQDVTRKTPHDTDFPTWKVIEPHISVDSTARMLIQLTAAAGHADPFLVIAAATEYLRIESGKLLMPQPDAHPEDPEDEDPDDLGDEGNGFLISQGFENNAEVD